MIDFSLGSLDGAPVSRGGIPWYVPPELSLRDQRKVPADAWVLDIVMLYLLKYLPLPDYSLQVKSWLIKDNTASQIKE